MILAVLESVLLLVGVVLAVPVTVLLLECVVAALPWSRRSAQIAHVPCEGSSLRTAVLIPAHDEADGIVGTVTGLLRELGPRDRVVVVADNCSDSTAVLARVAGARVVERHDPARCGKGHALRFGVEALAADPPDVVVIVDADCRLRRGSLRALVTRAAAEGRPMQATFTMQAPNRSPRSLVSELEVIVRNRVRLEGLRRLGLPCHLTGSGMAFPWSVLRDAAPLGGHLVEDPMLGIAIARQGRPPAYCPEAQVVRLLPARGPVALGQRRRWEHGQLQTLLAHAPRLVGQGLSWRRPELVALGLDLLVPPTTLLATLLALATAAAAGLALLGPTLPLAVLGVVLGGLVLAIVLAWARYGRERIPLAALATVPRYLAWKLPVYAAFAAGLRQRSWNRTARPRDVTGRLDRAGRASRARGS